MNATTSTPLGGGREIAVIVRREIVTRTANRTITLATAALAVIAGAGGWAGGSYLVEALRAAGPLPLDPQVLFATAMISALMASLVWSSTSLASGVVEEKSSRIVEILLTKVGVSRLLVGKLVGVGLVTLGQLLVVGGALVAGFSLADGWSVVDVEPGLGLVWFLVWFLQGYVLFAALSTLLASTVSRQEDLSTASSPLSVIQIVLLVVSLYVLPSQPDSPWLEGLSFAPFFSSYLMPMRFALDTVTTSQMVVAAIVAQVSIPMLFALAARVYRNNALRTGSRVSLRQSLASHDAA